MHPTKPKGKKPPAPPAPPRKPLQTADPRFRQDHPLHDGVLQLREQIADLEAKNAELLKFSMIKPPGDDQLVALQAERIKELEKLVVFLAEHQSATVWSHANVSHEDLTKEEFVDRHSKVTIEWAKRHEGNL